MKKSFIESKRFNLLIVVISLSLFITSLTQNAYTISDYNGDSTLKSIEVFLMGSTAILGGGLFEWIIWLANPVYSISLILFIITNRNPIILSLIAGILSLVFSSWTEILAAENGRTATILYHHSGYWIWTSAIWILTIGILIKMKTK
ncbi:MAG: hypothetical protein H6586_01220 [Flavobacteriales bacterium]|nr:hypothetical protein [Flavobacteriales bacterium]